MPFMAELNSCIKQRSSLANLFLQVQCRLCFVKGGIRLKEKMLLRDVAEALGFSKAEFLEICNATHLEADFNRSMAVAFFVMPTTPSSFSQTLKTETFARLPPAHVALPSR